MSQLDDTLNHQRNVMDNIQKSFGAGFDMNEELEKARHGVYADNATNRKLNRVGQEYGNAAKEDEKSTNVKLGGQDDSSYQKMAKEASDKALKRASEDENADPKVREMAKKELDKRGNNSGDSNERKSPKVDEEEELLSKENDTPDDKRRKRSVVRIIMNDGGNSTLDKFLDKNSKYVREDLKKFSVKNFTELGRKLEEMYEDDEKDPNGYLKFDRMVLKALSKIPAAEFKSIAKSYGLNN